ncbi:MAG: alpha/beta hydrolase [Bacteroidales bacterium]|nr:alpha/beta hydrolase [Bacteroidales bacterium]
MGIWQGKMAVGADSLSLVMVVERSGDTLRVVLDSPDQYVTDIAVDRCTFVNDTLRFSVRSLGASYTGRYDGDRIRGRFTQYGRKMKLNLSPASERKLFLRPQEPQPPYPYREVELSFPYEAGLPPINGTLTLPTEGKPKAVAVLLTGSGRQDRDETIFRHKPFKVIADYLTRRGFAVFRYDDPPYSTFAKQTTFDFARQAQVVFDTLSARPELAGVPVGFLGHSEGGMVAWIAAAAQPKTAFVISLAGVGTPISEILLYQTHVLGVASGLSDAQIRSNDQLNRSVYGIVEKSKTPEDAVKKLDVFFKKYTRKMSPEQRMALHLTDVEIAGICSQATSQWLFTLFHTRPADYLNQVQCPVLALNGDRDLQVEAAANLAGIKAGLLKSPSVTCHTLPELNHLMQECETGTVEEYGTIEQTMSPRVLEAVTEWLDKVIQSR